MDTALSLGQVLIPIGVAVAFALFWFLITSLIARLSGWTRMAEHYATTEQAPPEARPFQMQDAVVVRRADWASRPAASTWCPS